MARKDSMFHGKANCMVSFAMHELTELTPLRDQISAISSAIYQALDKQRYSWDLLHDHLSAISGVIHQTLHQTTAVFES